MTTDLLWRRRRVAAVAPPARPLPELRTRGAFFEQADGTRWTAVQCSDFNALARYLRGEDITPILEQRAACGFNLLRVWTLFDIDGIGTLLDPDYDRIPAFAELCRRYGLYIEFTAYTGINDPGHWPALIQAALRCQPRPLLELVNELDQNTNEPDYLGRVFHLDDHERPPAPLLASHGSNGSQALAVRPWWSYEEFHTNDAPQWTRKVGHNAMELADGTPDWPGSHVPILTNENTRFPDKVDSEWALQWAFDAAAGAALLNGGSSYHSVGGKTSVLWEGAELDCAKAWAAGARSVRLPWQDGSYIHESHELEEQTNCHRIYSRRLSDGSKETVYIRNPAP